MLAPLVGKHPGLRVPGHVDGFELLVRAIVGQQVSLAGARTVLGRMTAELGAALAAPDGGITLGFPTPAAVAAASPESFPMPMARATAVQQVAAAVERGDLFVDSGAERDSLYAQLLAMRGVGPWTVGYVGLRALGDPDVFLPTDLGVRRALEQLGCASDPTSAATRAQCWRPWRSYSLMHLWTSLSG